jgi:ATPase subunit of ABC transporter with duplicated ATPase domains
MPSIYAQRLSHAHSSAAPIFADVDLHLTVGWTGLVGENGAGKTTLLRLLAGELKPDAGQIRVEPSSARVTLCRQTIDRKDPAIERLAAAEDGFAYEIRGRLALSPPDLDRWETLSPGERKRWQIGAALAEEPEILLLDEPCNHLDIEARKLVVSALRRFEGIGILVSHDRTLLDALTTTTVRIHRGEAHAYRGPYDTARDTWEAESAHEREERARLVGEQHEIARQLDAVRRDHQSAFAERSSKKRMKGPKDHDGRGMLTKIRTESAEKRIGRSVGVVRDKLERKASEVASIHVEKELGGAIFVGFSRPPQPWLFTLDAPVVRAGDTELLRDVRVAVPREGRIRIEGPNGAGKSTLLGALARSARIPAERFLHLPQDLSAEARRGLLAEVRALGPAERGRTLSVVAALGLDPDRLLASAEPSPGEARKLAIALGLGRHVAALLLDEPENHLDLPSLERLEAALVAYPGAIVMVSHDAAFARRATQAVWRIERGAVVS